MTVDMLAATFFWPEGTLLHVREEMASDMDAHDPPGDQAADPILEPSGESFWAGILRQIGWPLPPKPATPG